MWHQLPLLLLENMETTEVTYTSRNYFRRESIFSPIIIHSAFIQMSFTQWAGFVGMHVGLNWDGWIKVFIYIYL